MVKQLAPCETAGQEVAIWVVTPQDFIGLGSANSRQFTALILRVLSVVLYRMFLILLLTFINEFHLLYSYLHDNQIVFLPTFPSLTTLTTL